MATGEPNHTWTAQQRAVLRLLYQRCGLGDDDVAKVFNYIVKELLKQKVSDNGVSMKKLKNIHEKKGSTWQETYDLDRPNAQELQRRQGFRAEMMVVVRQALKSLGMEEHSPKTGEEADSGTQPSTAARDATEEAMDNANKEVSPGPTSTMAMTKTHEDQPARLRASGSHALEDGAAGLASALSGSKLIIGSTNTSTGIGRRSTLSSGPSLRSSALPSASKMPATRSQNKGSDVPAAKSTKTKLHGSLGASIAIDPPTSDTSDSVASSETVPVLEMVHHRDCTWPIGLTHHGSSDHNQGKYYINHDHEIYKLGGTVHRCFVNGREEDVMLCNKDFCIYCLDVTTELTNWGDTGRRRQIPESAHTEINGLPFVHAKDCVVPVPGESGFHFAGVVPRDSGPWGPPWGPPKYPADIFTTKVTFRTRNGQLKRVKTTMCVHGKCPQCSGQAAVDKKKARYELGGVLYEKKKRQEEMEKGAGGKAGLG
ncbi:hypothetical protein LTR85_009036 [Meristemomyces frigidus]|nr:hypothetical protein LTR85_009036 [Meristemomyces frigidus]